MLKAHESDCIEFECWKHIITNQTAYKWTKQYHLTPRPLRKSNHERIQNFRRTSGNIFWPFLWQSHLKAISGDNRRFVKINDQALGAASTNTTCSQVGVSSCGQWSDWTCSLQEKVLSFLWYKLSSRVKKVSVLCKLWEANPPYWIFFFTWKLHLLRFRWISLELTIDKSSSHCCTQSSSLCPIFQSFKAWEQICMFWIKFYASANQQI